MRAFLRLAVDALTLAAATMLLSHLTGYWLTYMDLGVWSVVTGLIKIGPATVLLATREPSGVGDLVIDRDLVEPVAVLGVGERARQRGHPWAATSAAPSRPRSEASENTCVIRALIDICRPTEGRWAAWPSSQAKPRSVTERRAKARIESRCSARRPGSRALDAFIGPLSGGVRQSPERPLTAR